MTALNSSPLSDAITTFLLDQRLDTRAAWTLKKHRQELNRYGRWLDEQRLEWRTVSESDVLCYARTRVRLSASARGGTFCTLRVFYAWAVERRHLVASPAAKLKTPTRPRPQPKSLTIGQVRQLLAFLAGQEGCMARRDECLIAVAIYAGLRAQELAGLRWVDIDLDSGIITIPLSKANHGRRIPVHPCLCALLSRWYELCEPDDDQAPVFASSRGWTRGQALTPNSVGKISTRVREASGVKFTTHALRHTFATWVLRKSKDLYAVSKALGHQGLKQTEIYLSADTDQIAAAVGTLPDLTSW